MEISISIYGIYETGDGQLLLVERDDDTSYGYPLESGDAVYLYCIDRVAQIE